MSRVRLSANTQVRTGASGGSVGSLYEGVGRAASSHPTVLFLLGMVILEMFAFGGLRYVFRSVHGG